MKRRRDKPPFWFEDTFDRIRKLEEEFHRMLADFWRDPFEFETPEFKIPSIKIKGELGGNINVDVSETKDEVIVRADLPGFEKSEIKVKATEWDVTIEAEKKEETVEEGEKYYRKERRYGKVRRTVSLPAEVEPDKAKAKFENGVLEIRLPKKEPEETEEEKEIEIE